MSGDDVTITVRVNNQTAAGFRDINGNLRTMDGRFAATAGSVRRSGDGMTKALVDVKGALLSLAPAAVPVAASLAPIVLQAGAAGVALGAFGAALKPQIGSLSDAAKAQDKYASAVAQYGARSKQATQAQVESVQTLKAMPAATQQAAAGYSSLRDTFRSFSDSTAKFTMVPVERSFAILGQVIPKLTPMVEGTSTQLDRLMKVAGAGINSSGFDALSKKVSDFANQSLKGATDKAISFARALSEGNARGPIMSFMEYARQQGPAVKELITNLSEAVSNLLQGAAQAGPGMLTLVNAFAKLVAAMPPSMVGTLMSVYAGFKLIKLAGSGIGQVAGNVATLSSKLTAMRTAAVAAGGGMAGVNAALNTLSTGGKAMLAAGAVGALVLALHQLSDNKAPVAVDQLATSLNTLASTGKVTGALKANFNEMAESIAMVSKGASDNKIATMVSDFGTWVGLATGPGISDAKKNLDAWDKVMADNVRSGHTKEAAAQFDILRKGWLAGGGTLKRLNQFTDDYRNALADQKFEAKVAAESQGLFGKAAQDAAAKLNAQKNSADALRGSIQALNDENRKALGGMIGFEASIDSAMKAAKDNVGALKYANGQLDLNGDKARNLATAMSDLASSTEDAASQQYESTGSWEQASKIYERGRQQLFAVGKAAHMSQADIKKFADTYLNIDDFKKLKLQMDKADAEKSLNAFNAAVKRTPDSKSVTLKTLSKGAEQILDSFGLKVQRLPDGSVKVTSKTGGALAGIGSVASALSRLDGRTATTTVRYRTINEIITHSDTYRSVHDIVGKANGGLIRGYAGGGDVQAFPDGGYVQGPGSGTSDSILAYMGSGSVAAVSNTEYVMKAAAVRKYGVKMMDALNEGRLPVTHLAKGGLSQAAKDARGQLHGSFGISSFGRMAGYQRTPFEKSLGGATDVSSLVSALNGVAGQIRAAFSGRTESSLLHRLSSVGKSLIGYEKQLNSVTKSLASAKDKLNNLKDASSQLASSVKSNLIGSANITKAGANADGGTVTLASVKSGLIASRDKVTAFASALKQLKSKGYSKSIIQQVAEAGIDGGGLETAGALLQASGSEVASINSMQGQIASAAGSAGKTTADSVYGKAIKDQTASVNKLTAQQNKLEKSMASLAKSMEKLISRALKGKAAGGIVGAAASGGLRGGLTWVGEHEPELLDLPVGSRVWSGPDSRRKAQDAAWESMLNVPRRAGSPGRAEPLEVRVVLDVTRSSGSSGDFEELLVKTLRRAVRTRGGIMPAFSPPRGR